jgi:peptide-methionine (R)-S-oxide reductase
MDTPLTEEQKNRLREENPELYHVAFEKGTEMPFTGKLLHATGTGDFSCAVCNQPLFKSNAKFDSGTGWPSFDQAIEGSVKEITDVSHGMSRTEVTCSKCGSHLGHVFEDGPTETRKRYCMNSVCLDLTDDSEKK